jgi:uncharacterized protein
MFLAMKRKIGWGIVFGFLAINLVAYNHAYKFTHFSATGKERTKDPVELSAFSKAGLLLTGISNPKPQNSVKPTQPFTTVVIESDVSLEGWMINQPAAKGTVILFHGYTGFKSQLLDRAALFRKEGYNTLLIDFMGSGGSEGTETHLGYTESVEVRDVFEYVRSTGEKNIHLFGTSMGAAAILKAMNDYSLTPTSIILECPFGSLYDTVSARFRMMGVPSFPMAAVLTFWGGVQLNFWGFGHNPTEYASSVDVPTLLLFGERDDRVSMDETQAIFRNVQGQKRLVAYPDFGHDLFSHNEIEWEKDVSSFLAHLP